MTDPSTYYSDPRVGKLIVDACRYRYAAVRDRAGNIHRHFSANAKKSIWRFDLSLWRPVGDDPMIELHRHDGLADPRSIAWAVENEQAVEFIPEVSKLHDVERSPYCCVDLDPKVDIPLGSLIELTRLVAAQTGPDGPLGTLLPVAGQKVRFTGNRGFHVWSVFEKPIRFDAMRAALARVLEPVVSVMPILSLDSKRADGVYLDIAVNASGKVVRGPYSLHHKTGLCCIPVPSWDTFDIAMARPESVLARGPEREPW